MTMTSKSTPDARDTQNHGYVNLFVAEYIQEEGAAYPVEDSPSFATWCIGPVKDGTFYGVQVSQSDLLPKEDEVLVVNLDDCEALSSYSNGMPDYCIDLEANLPPRASDKLHFKPRAELPSSIRLDIIKALEEHRNFGRALMTK